MSLLRSCSLAMVVAGLVVSTSTADPDSRRGPELSPMERLAGRPATQPASQPDATASLPLTERAAMRLKLGKYALAEKDFAELLKNRQTVASATVGLAELYRRTGRYEQALKLLDSLTDLNVQISAEAPLTKAELLADLGRYEQALELAQSVLARDGENLRARWIAGQQLETLGRTDEARELYQWLDKWRTRDRPADAAGKTYAGLILDRYSMLISRPVQYATAILQDLYQTAYEDIDRQYWPARVAAGNLSLAKYKIAQAAEDYLAALEINPAAYEANLGLGWAALENWQFEAVDKQLDAARKVNAKNPAVHELAAALRMQERKYEEAAAVAAEGLRTNPRHVGCLALLASANMRLAQADKVADLTRQAEAINPKPARFYSIVADWQSAARQFDSAEAYYQKAIALAPWDPNPMASLGMMYMQTGEEQKASAILEKAFAIDRFNARSFNTLTLLDQLVSFESLESEHFIIKFDKSSDAVLGPYFRDYLESIYADLSRDYEVELARKSIIEIFPTHAQFSVRTTGKPWIPTVGACTGWVVAMYSPRDMAGTTRGFNWAHVLRHEFTHVVTLAATDNRISHWFTEGLAVHQEPGPRQWKWVRMLAEAARRDGLFPVERIDWGFIRPRPGSDDRELAYAQSEWMVEFIIDRFGYPKINRMLAAFRDGKPQAKVLADVLGVSQSQFNRQFKDWARKQVVEEWKLSVDPVPTVAAAHKVAATQPDAAAAQAELAVACLYARKPQEAEAAARKALAIDRDNVRALGVMGALLGNAPPNDPQREQKWNEAEPLLRRLAELDQANSLAPRLLARRALADDDTAAAVAWFMRLRLASPLDPASYIGLAGIYLSANRVELALPELAELAQREQSDPRYAIKLAGLYTQLGKPDQAAFWLNEAIQIDPFNPSLHEQLAVAYVDTKQPDKAVAELKVAIQLAPSNAAYWARLAYIYDAQGHAALARKAAQFAVKLDPHSPARDLLSK